MPITLRRDRRGIAYADERSFDRDAAGVLWTRVLTQPGRGRPEFGAVHALRQRIAMSGLRCQICGGPADVNAEGVLWLLDADASELRPGAEWTAHPPVCVPCVRHSVRACPHVRAGWVTVRVRSYVPYGVRGVLYGPARSGPVAVEAVTVPFGSGLLPWVRAGQLVMRLRDFVAVALPRG
jgi:hypothetical protein